MKISGSGLVGCQHRAAVWARLGNVWVMSEAFPVEHLSLQLTVPLFDTSFTDEQDVSEPC